ncbi:MAG: hypothetical protein NBV67_10625 [Tagaea sp.]|nr:hypothetical protein [Tagaea sp.]
MVIAVSPSKIFKWCGFSFPKWLLGKKENNQALWRALGDLKRGKHKKLHPRTEENLRAKLSTKLAGSVSLEAIERQCPDGPPWESAVRAFNAGVGLKDGAAFSTLAHEAVRLERQAKPVILAFEAGQYDTALNLLANADTPKVVSGASLAGRIESNDPKAHFVATAAPLIVSTTLYLFACFDADFDDSGESRYAKFMPKRANGRIQWPMERWLQSAMERAALTSMSDLEKLLFDGVDLGDAKRERRRWQSGKEFPAWTRVSAMARSVCRQRKHADFEAVSSFMRVELTATRFLHELFLFAKPFEKTFPGYDALKAFRDYPMMVDHARRLKAGLPAEASSP